MLKTYLIRFETIDRLISIKATGTPVQFAEKLKISERMLYEYLSAMKEMGAPIQYCKNRCSYYYEYEGRFIIDFALKRDPTRQK